MILTSPPLLAMSARNARLARLARKAGRVGSFIFACRAHLARPASLARASKEGAAAPGLAEPGLPWRWRAGNQEVLVGYAPESSRHWILRRESSPL